VQTQLAAPALAQLNAAAYRSLLLTERGELDAAQAAAHQVISTASAAGLEHTAQVVAAYLAMARVLVDRDDLVGIDEWLSRIADVEAVAPEPHIRLSAALVLAARREAAGDPERSLRGLRATTAQLEGWSPPVPLAEQRLACEAALLARTVRAAEHRVALANRRRRQRTAGMRRASVVALVLPRGPVLDEGLGSAASTACPQVREEPLVRAWAQLRQRGEGLLAKGGHDEVVDQQGIARAGARLDLVTGQPLGQQHPNVTFVRTAV
jgi:hypothetical protein